MNETVTRIRDARVVAVLRASSPEELMEVAGALREGGIRCLEFTMTTPGALEMIRHASCELDEDVLLGAGTILTGEAAEAAVEAGARFLVSPALKIEVVEAARRRGVPVMPGAFTPSEALAAWDAGADVVKIFPAGQLGPSYLKDLHGPFPDIPLMPTGGIGIDDAAAYLQAGAVAVGVGGNLTRRAAGESLSDLTDRARQLMKNLRL
ncbi:MAG: bifunctional 4-hydroxy-2-oxoglutarate aldolase/2-dehydro-3-deoxy-phosphogluconate aldolase [Armatimonadetes bacterium]|nr:bifunctional 4-hydroxy-2-oxoglutarate aldolase/2-dehydro-3-deoxy-phosphogluconate aldolase [Armatimonadota bacterium]